ncbi:hypothetical protein FEM33_21555 [Dyadobacter flavalbus]|uniref:T9SS type A sorting domain-containing protein n=1 Tax=Dyadobacter flavalbus TaxID=2579942 RepID=A0A5M8QKM4_9BACT|nr:hypothetical protein [Dyadobacter flavalbus]KAA6436727.1 hypothetical protein FEM33_21555 [Dyadobacter flavalbus]
MKKMLTSLAAAAFGILLLSSNVSALPVETKAECKNNSCRNFRMGMYQIRNTVTMKVLIEKALGERMAIRLMNDKGQVLHEEHIGKATRKFGRKLNFSEIQDGNYTLEISDNQERIVKYIRLATKDVSEVSRTLVAMN